MYNFNFIPKELPQIICIYRIHNKINGKNYIGSTMNFRRRMSKHRAELDKYSHKNKHLINAWHKYGKENFVIYIEEIFDSITKQELHDKEQLCIDCYKSLNENFGYNLMEVDIFTKNLSKDSIKKQQQDNELRKKKVVAINKDSGKLEYKFESVSDAARYFKTSSSNISRTCSGKINFIKGYIFVYENEYDPTKSYIYIKSKKIVSEETKRKMRENNLKSITVFKYKDDILIDTYSSRRYCEKMNNFKTDFLRRRLPYFDGEYLYTTIKI